jgi:integrase
LRGTIDVAEIADETGGHLTYGPPKTRASRRVVSLPRPVIAELEDRLIAVTDPTALVFPAPEGGGLRVNSWRRRFWLPAVMAAGLEPLRPHDMRHTAVALWIAAGASPLEVARRAGHTSTSFTLDRYGHLFPAADEILRGKLEAMMTGVPQSADSRVVSIDVNR